MSKLYLKMTEASQIKRFALVLSLVILVSLPAFSFSGGRSNLYVDDSNHGSEDGSKSHPFNTIKEAMHEADKKTDIHISKGFYKENVEIKKGVRLYGEDEDKVTIEAKSSKDKAAVLMNDETVIDNIKVRKGKYGIKVRSEAEASIVDCIIEDAERDGIRIKIGKIKDSRLVSISESVIKDNDGAGIDSDKRKLSIVKSEIRDNGGDGIDIAAGSHVWMYKNYITDNEKSGMKLRIDQSNIWTKKNKITRNGREGIEINFYGGAGRIDIKDSGVFKNDRNGIARVQRGFAGNSWGLWNSYLTFSGINNIGENGHGNISKVCVLAN